MIVYQSSRAVGCLEFVGKILLIDRVIFGIWFGKVHPPHLGFSIHSLIFDSLYIIYNLPNTTTHCIKNCNIQH